MLLFRCVEKTDELLARLASTISAQVFSRKPSFLYPRLHCASTCSTAVAVSLQRSFDYSEYLGTSADVFTYTSLVQKCGLAKSLPLGYLLHALIFMDTPFCNNTHLLSLLVQMYGQCIALEDAHAVFVHIQEKNVYSWNIMMGTNAKLGLWLKTDEFYHRMQLECILPDKFSIVSTLSARIGLNKLSQGKALHAGFACTELEKDVIVGTALINFYGHCSSAKLAMMTFEKLGEHDLVSVNALMAVCAQQGQEKAAFQLFDDMMQQGFIPNRVTFLAVVDACDTATSLCVGKKFHAYVSCTDYGLDAFVLTSFMSMYGKCDELEMVVILFDKMSERNVVPWNAIIAVHAHQEHRDDVLQLFCQMQEEGSLPDKVTFRTILCSFTGHSNLSKGKSIHIYVSCCGFDIDMVVGTALFSMYGRCGSLESARELFDRMANKDVVAWNAMITLYAQSELGGGNVVMELIEQMQVAGVPPDKVTLTSGLSACVGLSFQAAWSLFEMVRERNVLAWNAMLGACEQQGYIEHACHVFVQMLEEGFTPDKVTYLIVLSLCASKAAAFEGKCMHTSIVYCHCESEGSLVCGLMSMYSKCGCLVELYWVFRGTLARDTVVFNSFITACADHGYSTEVLQLWGQMLHEAVIPDKITYIGLLDACATQGALAIGKFVHARIMKSDYVSDISVATSLFSMYHKCSNLEEALNVFSRIIQHDVVSWTAILSASAEQKQSQVVLQLFHQMQNEGVHADSGMYVNVLTACADEAALTEGKILHSQILYDISRPDVALRNSLINLYSKCGCMEYAQREFEKMTGRDVLTFNVMIGGLAQHGHGVEALQLFNVMQEDKTSPNEYTFSSMLSACSHGGLVEEGRACLVNFIHQYCWRPSIENFDCVVDFLGRSGQLEQAECLLDAVPLQPTSVSYMTLLGAARIQMDIWKGGLASQFLLELDLEDAACYVALANLYALAEQVADYNSRYAAFLA